MHQNILPLVALGLVLNFGFVSIFVVRNLFLSTHNIIEHIKAKFTRYTSSNVLFGNDPSVTVFTKYQNKVISIEKVFYSSVVHNLIHALAIINGFVFLIFICFASLFVDGCSQNTKMLVFHINAILLVVTLIEASRILFALIIPKRENVQKRIKIGGIKPEEEFMPYFYKTKTGGLFLLVVLVILLGIYWQVCLKTQPDFKEKTIAILLLINLYLIFVIKVIYNLYIRVRIWFIARIFDIDY